jgi:CheY-like chemotaxis protein
MSEGGPTFAAMTATNPKRVLVVDDNPEAASALGDVLELAGHKVVTADDPVAALDVAHQFAPDVCILDIELPIMDGYELGKRLREQEPRCVLIALTGYSHEHNRSRSQDAGFEHYLVKPVDTDRLLRIVGEAPPTDHQSA